MSTFQKGVEREWNIPIYLEPLKTANLHKLQISNLQPSKKLLWRKFALFESFAFKKDFRDETHTL